jgi:hypothetical protein
MKNWYRLQTGSNHWTRAFHVVPVQFGRDLSKHSHYNQIVWDESAVNTRRVGGCHCLHHQGWTWRVTRPNPLFIPEMDGNWGRGNELIFSEQGTF